MIVFNFIKANKFFPQYAPNVVNYKHKLRGFAGNGKPLSWTKEDKRAIRSGLRHMISDLLKSI